MFLLNVLVSVPVALASFLYTVEKQGQLNVVTLPQGALTANGVFAYGWVKCDTGEGRVIELAYMQENRYTLIHELLHTVDCLDNNAMDGSPLPREVETCNLATTDCAHRWVDWGIAHPTEATAIINGMRQ